jgi:hypothetical protein
MDLDQAAPTATNLLQEDEDVCIIVTESNSKNNKQKREKLTKQISLMQGKGCYHTSTGGTVQTKVPSDTLWNPPSTLIHALFFKTPI